MQILNRDTDYAVRTLARMFREEGRSYSSAELEKLLEIPRPFIRKILQKLQKAGLLSSSKGADGGFRLRKTSQDIRLLEIIEIFQQDFHMCECLFLRKICPDQKHCVLRKKINHIQEVIIRELEQVTLQSRLENETRRGES